MVFESEIFLTGLFFILFFTIIIIFGFLLILILHKDIINLPSFIVIGISLGCGIVFYVFFSYIMDTIAIFNFFTILFPIILFDIVGLIYFLNSNFRIKQKLNFPYFKQWVVKNYKEVIFFLFSFIIVFYFQLELQLNIINKSESLLAGDTFYWCRSAMYLLDYGHLEYNMIGFYSAGYIFLNTGMCSFFPEYRFIYFFHRFVPIFYLSLIVLIGFLISRLLFKQKFLSFLTMFGFLTLSYFNTRFIMALPSAPATILFFLFSITFINSKIPFYFKGVLIAGTILFHPLLGAIGFSIFMIYIILHFLTLVIKRKEKKKVIYLFFKESICNIVIFFGILIPVIINLSLNYPIWFTRYWNTLFPINISKFNSIFWINDNCASVINYPLFLGGNFSYERLVGYFDLIIRRTFINNPIIFFILIYFFIRIKKKNYKNFVNFISIVKIIIVISFIYHFFYFFMAWFFPIGTFGNLLWFFDIFKDRVFEFSAGFIILMCVFVVYDIYVILRRLTIKLKNIFPKYKKFLNRKNYRSFKDKMIHIILSVFRIEYGFLIIVLCFSYNLYQNNNFLYHYYYYDDDLIEMMLTIGDSAPVKTGTKSIILTPPFEQKVIFYLLYRYEYHFINFNSSYSTLTELIITKNASYVMFPVEEGLEELIRTFAINHEIIYEDSKYIVIKIK